MKLRKYFRVVIFFWESFEKYGSFLGLGRGKYVRFDCERRNCSIEWKFRQVDTFYRNLKNNNGRMR